MPEQLEDVVKITLSAYKLDNVDVREAIREIYNTEIIGLANSAGISNQSWDAPTFAQSSRPIVNSCPPPNVRIEVFHNKDPDRSHALSKYVGIAIPYAINPFYPNPNQI
ncbi:6386_t:CDS:2 [Diversispora eburnea]|uniref:6386_t:CDS:1 n=1 Tax=Diversispora eburnea TaxID=1213867 RepID=A0A9N8ZMT7_9GLOM|nr:6386_t:CDS:2 [Diversispora eburnea]